MSIYICLISKVFLVANRLAIMENQDIGFRAVIIFFTKEETNAKEIQTQMTWLYGDCSSAYSTVAKRAYELKRWHSSLEDDPPSGRQSDVITKKIMASVETLIINGRRIKINDKAIESKFSHGSVSTIINEHLGMSIVCVRWAPKISMCRIASKTCSQVESFSARMRKIQRAFMHV